MDREEILKELDEYINIPIVGEFEFTLKALCARYKLSTSGMRGKMNELVREGKWETDLRRDPGSNRLVRVWWKIT